MSVRVTSTLTVLLLSTTLAGCGLHAAPKSASAGTKVAPENIGLATRAQMALEQNDTATAIALAERAVTASPDDAGFRGLLGNSYFAGGRFASAESAYRDALTLQPGQPKIVLKLALVTIAQGKNAQAIADLDAARATLDPADYGLALALAGQPQRAAELLQTEAEKVNADGRVRQNLALALALSGDWTTARIVAAQDVPGDQLDARIQQWMQMAKPARVSDQVAALTGIAPAASDPGQPARLALKDAPIRSAAAAPAAPAAPTPAPVAPQAAEAASAVAVAQQIDVPAVPTVAEPGLAIELAAAPAPAPAAMPAQADPLAPRAAVAAKRGSGAVVQLGAYGTRSAVDGAWTKVSARFPALRGYKPVAARFDGGKGTVYRLSVQVASASQANSLCGSLKRAGGACFVRGAAGDAPVQMASR